MKTSYCCRCVSSEQCLSASSLLFFLLDNLLLLQLDSSVCLLGGQLVRVKVLWLLVERGLLVLSIAVSLMKELLLELSLFLSRSKTVLLFSSASSHDLSPRAKGSQCLVPNVVLATNIPSTLSVQLSIQRQHASSVLPSPCVLVKLSPWLHQESDLSRYL